MDYDNNYGVKVYAVRKPDDSNPDCDNCITWTFDVYGLPAEGPYVQG